MAKINIFDLSVSQLEELSEQELAGISGGLQAFLTFLSSLKLQREGGAFKQTLTRQTLTSQSHSTGVGVAFSGKAEVAYRQFLNFLAS